MSLPFLVLFSKWEVIKNTSCRGANKNHDEGIDCKNLSLFEIKCHEWLGIVFINVNKIWEVLIMQV